MWSRNGNTQTGQDPVCVTVALGETTESHGNVYTTIAGKFSHTTNKFTEE